MTDHERRRTAALQRAYDALHFYVDAHDNELKERGITRDDALRLAREAEKVLIEIDFAATLPARQPFDLEAAKRGEPLVTRDGRSARFIETFGTPAVSLSAELGGVTQWFYVNGRFKSHHDHPLDLFMAPPATVVDPSRRDTVRMRAALKILNDGAQAAHAFRQSAVGQSEAYNALELAVEAAKLLLGKNDE